VGAERIRVSSSGLIITSTAYANTFVGNLTGNASTVTTNANLTGDVTSVGNATTIATGVIVNADVNAAAAIAGTKINPDFGGQTIVTTGESSASKFSVVGVTTPPVNGVYLSASNTVGIAASSSPAMRLTSSSILCLGQATPRVIGSSITPGLQLEGNTNVSLGSIGLIENRNDSLSSRLCFSKSRGTTYGSHTIVQNGDKLGEIYFDGTDGTSSVLGALIKAEVDGTPSTNDMPGRIVLSTTADGASSPTERMRIGSTGVVAIGSTTTVGGASGTTLRWANDLTGATYTRGIYGTPVIQSDVTSNAVLYETTPSTVASAFTLAALMHYAATQGTIGAGSTVTNQYGFIANGSLTGATNNYGFFSNIAAGTDRWNFYANGTAENYFTGATTVASTLTANSFIPTSATVPTNGLYLPSANTVGIATGSAERLRIDGNGRLLVSTTTAYAGRNYLNNIITPQAQLHGTTNPTSTQSLVNWSATSAGPAQLLLAKSRGASIGTNAIVSAGDDVGVITFGADDGAVFIPMASILAEVDGTPGLNDMPGRIVLSTTADGASTPTERMRIDSAGRVGIGVVPAESLDIGGTDNLHLRGATYTNFSDYWGSGDGRGLMMPYGFLGTSGAFSVSLYSNGYRNASSGFTYMGINGNTTTAAGIDLQPDGSITLRTGTAVGTTLPARLTIGSAGNVTILNEATVTATLTANSFIPTSATVPTNGLYLPAANTVGIATNSVERMRIAANSITCFGQTTARVFGGSVIAGFQIEANTSISTGSIGLMQNRNDVAASRLCFGKSRGTTHGSSTILLSGDELGHISFDGADGASLIRGASIRAEVDGTPGLSDMPGRIVLSTTADGSSTPTERMRIDSAGNVGIGTTPACALHVVTNTNSATPTPVELRLASSNNASDWSTTLPWSRLSFYSADVTESGPKVEIALDAIKTGSTGGLSHFSFKMAQSGGGALSEIYRIERTGHFKLGGTAARATTAGTNILSIFDGTAPVGALTNGISLYSEAGEAKVMDSSGNATLISPHDDEGYWIFDSTDTRNNRRLLVHMEKMAKWIDATWGTNFVEEFGGPPVPV
jgi:hypothetical protein